MRYQKCTHFFKDLGDLKGVIWADVITKNEQMNKMVSLCHIGVPMTETEKEETAEVWRVKERRRIEGGKGGRQ